MATQPAPVTASPALVPITLPSTTATQSQRPSELQDLRKGLTAGPHHSRTLRAARLVLTLGLVALLGAVALVALLDRTDLRTCGTTPTLDTAHCVWRHVSATAKGALPSREAVREVLDTVQGAVADVLPSQEVVAAALGKLQQGLAAALPSQEAVVGVVQGAREAAAELGLRIQQGLQGWMGSK